MVRLHCVFVVLLPLVLTQKTPDVIQNPDTKEVANEVLQIKEIPQGEIITLPVHLAENRKVDSLEVIEIKPLVHPVKTKLTILDPEPKKKNKSKLNNRRAKLIKKQNKKSKKNAKLKQKQLKKQLRNRKKQMLRKYRRKNKARKQTRNSDSGKLSEVIDLILLHHKNIDGSKLPTEQIKQQILDLMKGQKMVEQALRPIKDCPKPKFNKRKRKLLRSLKKTKSLTMRQKKKSNDPKDTQVVSVKTDIGIGKDTTNTIEKVAKIGKTKGKIKSKVNVKFDRNKKKRSRKTKKKIIAKNSEKL